MKKISTLLFFLFLCINIFGQKESPILNGSKEPMPVDNTDVSTIPLPLALKPNLTLLPKSVTAFSSAMTFIPKEIESNGTSATAMPLNGTDIKIRGNIFPIGDIDFYSFQATAGDKVYAAAMTSFSAGSSTDSQLTLLASDGTTVIEFDDDNGSLAGLSSSIAGATIPATGTYYIKINDFTAGTTTERSYDLYLKVQSGGSPTPEVEGNDTPAAANVLPNSGWVSGARNIAAATEQDWYSVTLNAGETLFISLDLDPERDGTVWNGRLGVALFGDAGNQILVVDDAGTGDVTPFPNRPSEALFFTVKTTGTYYVFVDSASGAVGGATATYNLSVSKLDAPTGYTNYASTDVPKTIGPETGVVPSTITIPDNKNIKDIRVNVVLNHALMQDIDAILTSPDGNKIALFTDIGAGATGGQTQMDANFGDYNAVPPSFTVLKGVALMPELGSKLDQLRGMKSNGVWTLDLFDDTAGANGGTLTSWSIDILEEPLSTQSAAYTSIFNQDFEASDGGFTHSGTGDQWARGTPATVATTTANPIAAFNSGNNSSANCFKTNLTGTYNVSTVQDLKSPSIDLTAVTANVVVLSWAMKYQMEAASFDHFRVTVQEVGNPSNSKEVFVWLGATQTAQAGNPTINVPMSSGWGTYYVDVSEFKGKNIEIIFHLDTDSTVNLGGVAIDDVSVKVSCTTPVAPTVTPPSPLVACSPSTLTLTANCSVGTVTWSEGGATGTSLTLSAVGTYSITATCSNGGCTSVASSPVIDLAINVKPTTPTVTPPAILSVCSPSTLTLTASCEAGTVTWSNAATGTSLTLSAAGTYSITATCNLNDCFSDPSTAVNGLEIKSTPIPTAVMVSSTSICSGTNVVLSASCGGVPSSPFQVITPTPQQIANGDDPTLVTTNSPSNSNIVQLLWYDVASGGTAIGVGNNLQATPLTTTTYYAVCSENGCESSRVATAQVVVTTTPTQPTVDVFAGIVIQENSGTTLTDYQVRIVLNTQAIIGAGQMQANGADLRFFDGITPVNYWIESGINTPNTVIWLKIPSLAANSSKNISVQFNNPLALPQSNLAGVFDFHQSATDQVQSGGAGGATNTQRGFRFSPNEDILVNAFGKREPNGTTRYVTLFNYNTQAIVEQKQVAGAAATYTYEDLTNPVWLTQNQQYLLILHQGGSSDGYYFGTSSQINSKLTYYDMRYCNSCTQNTFPTSILTNYHYGYPDFSFYTKKSSPNPPTFSYLAGTSSIPCGTSTNLAATCGTGMVKWYNAATGGASIGSGSVINTGNLSNNTSFYASCETGGSPNCLSPRTQFDVTVTGIPTIPTSVSVNNTSICAGVNVVLSASCGAPTGPIFPTQPSGNVTQQTGALHNGLLANSPNDAGVIWYTQASGGTAIGMGSPLNHAPTANTTYYAACIDGICESVRVATNAVTVLTPPAIPTNAANQTICIGSTASLSATCAIGSVKWFDASGTNLLATGSPFLTPTLSSDTDYKVRCDDGICQSAFVTVSVMMLSGIDAGTGVDGAYSATSNTTLAGGTYNFTNFNIDAGVTVTVTGTQPLYIKATGAVTINGTLLAKGSDGTNGVTYTSGGTGGIGIAGGANGGNGIFSSSLGPLDGFDGIGLGGIGNKGKAWSGGGGAGYAAIGASSGNSAGGFGGAIYGSANITGSEAGSGGGGGSGGYDCGAGGGGAGGGFVRISAQTSINIGATGVINTNGGNGGTDGTGNCGGGGGGSGGSLWLASPSFTQNGSLLALGGTGGASAVNYAPYFGTGADGSVGRIRLDYNGSLVGSGTAQPAVGATNTIILAVVSPPTGTSNPTICNNATASLSATCASGTVNWYDAGGTALQGTGSPFVTPNLTTNTSYKVRCEATCNSTFVDVTVSINPVTTPIVTPPSQLVVCSPATLTLTATCATGNVIWSDNSTGTSLTLNTVGTYAISAKCNLNGCDSNQSSATSLEIKAKPNAPSVSAPSQLIVCSPTTLTLTATCTTGNVLWSDNSTGTSLTLSAVGTYSISAKCQLNGCDSDQSSATSLEIKAKPNAPSVSAPSQLIVCSPTTLTLTASCATGNVLWSDNSTGTSLTLSAVGTYSISAKCQLNGCDSDQSSATNLEIKAKPNSPTVTAPEITSVCSPATLTLTASCSTGNVLWSDNSTGTSLTLSVVGTYSISAKCTLNGCDSDQSSATNLEIKALPNAQASNTGPYLFGQTISLSASGGSTYSWAGPNSFASTLANPTINNAQIPLSGTYTVTVTNGGCSATATTNVVVSGIDPCTQIMSYTYVQAGNPHQALFNLTNGMNIAQRPTGTSIIVKPICNTVTIESVDMTITGPSLNFTILQNVEPFALFDNFGPNIYGQVLAPGTYALTVTGYMGDNRTGGTTYGPVVTTFTIVGIAPTISTPTFAGTEFCAGSSVNVSFTTTGTFAGGNQFNILLSDANGSFAVPQIIGTATVAGTVLCTIPIMAVGGENYRIKVVSTDPAAAGNYNLAALTVNPVTYNLVSPTNDYPVGTATKKAIENINARNNITGASRINYFAGKAINLTPGFQVVSHPGSSFKAQIEGCGY